MKPSALPLICATLVLLAACDSGPNADDHRPAIASPSAVTENQDLAGKGKPPKNNGSPIVHGVLVRTASPSDLSAWNAWPSFTYETSASPSYYDGTNSDAPSIATPEEFFGCPQAGPACLAVEVELSGYAADDHITLIAHPLNQDAACTGAIAAGTGETIGNSCAHDTSLGSSRRLASLFLGTRGTPWVRFGDMPSSGDNRVFTFLWQGQRSTGGGTGLARSFYPDIEPGNPDGFRFQPYRQNQGGSSLDQVDCLFGANSDTPSACVGAFGGAPASGHLLTPSYSASSRTETIGKGRNRQTVTVTTVSIGATSGGVTYGPSEMWTTLIHADPTGAREVLAVNGTFDLPGTGCHAYTPLEIELYAPVPGGEDYALDFNLTPLSVSDGSIGPC